MYLFKHEKGTVSVFLVLILVPVLAVTSLFVDASRMMLIQPVVSSGGDLAVNTALSQFDADLYTQYGLFALSDQSDEVEAGVKESFYNALQIQNLDSNKSVSNFLRINVDSDTFSAASIKDSGLNNPDVLKAQIVDFMKNRTSTEDSEKVQNQLSEIAQATSEVAKEFELIEKKQKALNAEQTLSRTLNQIGSYGVIYNSILKRCNKKQANYFQYITNNCNNLSKEYKKINRKVYLTYSNFAHGF